MNKASSEFNKQLELDVLVNNLTEVTEEYACSFAFTDSVNEVVIPDGITSIGKWAFSGCSDLKKVTISNSVTQIKHCAFEGCINLKNVIIPDSVELIDSVAFDSCYNLKTVVIGKGATYIRDNAFVCCDNLKSVIFKGKTLDEVRSMEYYPWGIKHPEKVISVQVS